MARVLVILPSWIGDAVMATPALRMLRDALPGALIGALARPGIDALLDGAGLVDDLHVARPTGVLGPKHIAAKLRPRRYDTALLLTGSFSTALVARIAGIPGRIGYDRDARGFLLTRRLLPPRTPRGGWAIVPACSYYAHAVRALLEPSGPAALAAPPLDHPTHAALGLPPHARLRLGLTERDHAEAQALRDRAGLSAGEPFALLNPGGNNPAKRWPAERFAALAERLGRAHGLRVLVNGSPDEAELCATIADAGGPGCLSLPAHGGTMRTLKVLASGARLMVTNDTGPRHIAAAFGTPLVSLFGPTDPRWTTLPSDHPANDPRGEQIIVADPTLPPALSANDHPERCAIDRLELQRVIEAAEAALRAGVGERGM